MVAGPEKPACASAAACRPAHALAARTHELGRRERRRENGRAQVEGAALMRVVHLEGMRGRAVGERRVRCGEALRRAEHGRAAAELERHEPAAEDDARLLARAAERDAEMVA